MRFILFLVVFICNCIESTESSSPISIFFFGLSGVGKTTLIHKIAELDPKIFYIPKFTVTREPRKDDNPNEFEYISPEEFLQRKEKKEFYIWMGLGKNIFYGYRLENLNDPNRIPLLNGSPHGIELIKKLPGFCILIDGDASKGLYLRNDPENLKKREEINRLSLQFFDLDFQTKMDLIFYNEFGLPDQSAKELREYIFNLLSTKIVTSEN